MALSHIVIGTIVLAIFSIILAATWVNFLNLFIEQYFPGLKSEALNFGVYVLVLTFLVMAVAGYFLPKFDEEFRNPRLAKQEEEDVERSTHLLEDIIPDIA